MASGRGTRGSVIDSATVAVWPLPALGVLAVAAP
ncbi:hypothetical protein SAMN05216388_10894, partial [Halorientalis persicus]